MTMEYRPLGRSGPGVSVISLGSWNTFNRLLFEDSVKLLRGAFDLGVNFFDTSFYPIGPHKTASGPHTEVIFGRILEASGLRREDYVLSEKLWFYSYPEQTLADQMDRSLFRLNAKYVDLVSVAMPRDELDLARVLREVAALIAAGKACAWGGMNWTAESIRRADEICGRERLPRPRIMQIKYNVLRRNVIEQDEWDRLLADTDMTLHASDALEGGILAGKLVPEREVGSDNGGLRPRFVGRFAEYKALAEQFGATPAQLALALCLVHPGMTSVLIGASSLAQIGENIGAIALARKHGRGLADALRPFSDANHYVDKAYRGRFAPDDLGGFKGSYKRPA